LASFYTNKHLPSQKITPVPHTSLPTVGSELLCGSARRGHGTSGNRFRSYWQGDWKSYRFWR